MSIQPGIYYDLPMAEYLAIPALSQGPAFACIDDCPAAGWFESYLNPEPPESDDSNESDIGTIAHSILLDKSEEHVRVIDPVEYRSKPTKDNPDGAIPKGWTNNAIRAARDEARAEGMIPVLVEDWNNVHDMHQETVRFISLLSEEEAILDMWRAGGGKSEVTIVWSEGDELCKLRADRVSNDWAIECNYKTTPGSVEPERWARTQLFGAGYYFGSAWYRRGIEAATGIEPTSIFLAQSTTRPYRCSLIGVDPAVAAFGDGQVATALKVWQRCRAASSWPGYAKRVAYPELPAWMASQWEMREAGY